MAKNSLQKITVLTFLLISTFFIECRATITQPSSEEMISNAVRVASPNTSYKFGESASCNFIVTGIFISKTAIIYEVNIQGKIGICTFPMNSTIVTLEQELSMIYADSEFGIARGFGRAFQAYNSKHYIGFERKNTTIELASSSVYTLPESSQNRAKSTPYLELLKAKQDIKAKTDENRSIRYSQIIADIRKLLESNETSEATASILAARNEWPEKQEWLTLINEAIARCIARCEPNQGASQLASLEKGFQSTTKNQLPQDIHKLAMLFGNTSQVLKWASPHNLEAIKRATSVAASKNDRKISEEALVKEILDGFLITHLKMESGGITSASDIDAIFARTVEAKISSKVKFNAYFDSNVYSPEFDYVVNGKIEITVNGKENGERNCGVLWLDRCKIDNHDSVRTYTSPLNISLSKAGKHRSFGESTAEWKSLSGGTGAASGLTMGGVVVFKAISVRIKYIPDYVSLQNN